MDGKRSFTVVKNEGAALKDTRYVSSAPYSAAAKAARRLFAELPAKSTKDEIRFTIRETTQGSAAKEFRYVALKRQLDKPKVVLIAGTTVTYHHEYKVKSCRI